MATLTLAKELESSAVEFDQLERDYKPLLRLAQELLGTVPNCHPYLEIWPPAFRAYNLLMPNLLNMPGALLGNGAPKDLVGLAMYSVSRAAGCMYCSAHSCSFALRRGLAADVVTGNYNEVEAAVVSVAESLGQIPSDLKMAQVEELERLMPAGEAEWLLMAMSLMGFLNKFMDGMGIELESGPIADVQDLITPTGWTTGKHQWDDDLEVESSCEVPQDSLSTYLRVFMQGPMAARLERGWTKGVSGRIGPALVMLEEHAGYSFPVLSSLQHKRPVKAIATVLRDSLDPELSEVGLEPKILAGVVYAKTVEDEMLLAEMVQLTDSMGLYIDPDVLVDVAHFASLGSEEARIPTGLTTAEAAAIILAKAGSTSPSSINDITISTVAMQLTPPQIIELVVWLAVLQMLHRLYAYYDAKIGLV